ncbi:Bcr/CflA family multidrug efflux MFS transporter [Vibrio mangrovi]|uniref:Bcr/CflA family efflux transporter n=1 Tax=Vibrio mangrovi TaxID=474394 RepID=A0A1Y6INZ7_9VIBR|nr:Bcr/CflA family multidrug efflux MFS transporter [Vibrio mangrovi]MDW6003847.1 Bcr/CflA family multidrug efflux MFS transporter [Vibrio mangrovi]SMR99358.1 Bicyclomycin resistance protein [Vibrio mangrovi]
MSTEQGLKHDNSPRMDLLLFIVLGAIGAITPLAIDMYLPAMPVIAKDLGVSAGSVQMTLTAYTAGFTIGQLIHGPVSDSYGRRPVMLLGIVLFGIGSVVCASADNIDALASVRAAQGFAGAAAAVVIQAVVRDMFDRENFARAMSFITLVITLAPLVAPMLGGHLAVFFGWRSIFWVLTGFALVVILMVLWKIPETLQHENRQPLHLKTTLKNYWRLCLSVQSLGLMLCGGFSFAGMFSFLTAGSFIYVDIYGVSPDMFGYLFGLNILAIMLMTSINSRVVKKVGSVFMLRFGLWVQFLAGAGLFIGWLYEWGLWGIVPFVVLFIGMISTIGSNSMGLLMSGHAQMAGTVSSLAGTFRFGIGSLIGAIVAAMPGDAVWPMVLSMGLCAILSGLSYWVSTRE